MLARQLKLHRYSCAQVVCVRKGVHEHCLPMYMVPCDREMLQHLHAVQRGMLCAASAAYNMTQDLCCNSWALTAQEAAAAAAADNTIALEECLHICCKKMPRRGAVAADLLLLQ